MRAGDAFASVNRSGSSAQALPSKPRAGAPKAAHHLVGDEQDAVTVTDSRNLCQYSGGGAMPLVPAAGSAIIAATVCGPSYWITSSTCSAQRSPHESVGQAERATKQ